MRALMYWTVWCCKDLKAELSKSRNKRPEWFTIYLKTCSKLPFQGKKYI